MVSRIRSDRLNNGLVVVMNQGHPPISVKSLGPEYSHDIAKSCNQLPSDQLVPKEVSLDGEPNAMSRRSER